MFEAKCPSCNASYQVDERRVPPTGLKMRCPKCGESFQVSVPVHSEPPVLGAVLGLKKDQARTERKATMLGIADQPAPPQRPLPPRAGAKKTMMGVAPGRLGDGFELASLDEDLVDDSGMDVDELDLTAPDVGSELDLASPRDLNPPPRGFPKGGMDLPVPSSRGRRPGQIDLPSDSNGPLSGDNPFSSRNNLPALPGDLPDLDAEMDLPDLSANLPSRADDLPDLAGDLPTVASAGLPDLGAGLPDLGAGLPKVGGRLPAVKAAAAPLGGADPFGEVDPFGEADPFGDPAELGDDDFELGSAHSSPRDSLGGSGFDLSAPPPPRKSSPPAGSADDIFGQGPTQAPKSVKPVRRSDGDPASFGEVNLGGDAGADTGNLDDDEFDAFPTEEGGPSAGEGGGNYGNVSLEGGSGALDLGDDVRPNYPVGGPASPSPRGTAAATARVELPGPSKGKEKEEQKEKRRKTTGLSKGTRVAIGGALLLAIGGGALSLLPDIGPYGAYLLIDTIKADDYQAHLSSDLAQVKKLLDNDTAADVSRAFLILETGRNAAPRFKDRAAYTAFIGFLHRLRFGADGSESAQAEVLLGGLAEADPSTPYLALARLTQKASDGNPEEAALGAERMLSQSIDFAVVIGESALLVEDTKLAEKAWQAVLSKGATARAHYGMARALRLAQKPDEARRHVDETLKVNSGHAGARLLLAEMQVRAREHDEEIVKSLTPLSEGRGASEGERVQALVILGDLHLARARLKKAEASFTEALKLNAGNAHAQRGLAQTLFDSGRYSEALARFEAALQKAPKDLAANLGLVESKLRLEQIDDAVKHLAKLAKDHPNSTAVSYWVGRGKEAVGEKDEATKAFDQAIKHGNDVPELVLSYIALTRLLSQKGNLEEAEEVISQAEKRFPNDPAVYEALGELSSSRGSFDDAVADYDRALALDPTNIGLRFARGIALRQARRFKEAEAEFDLVEKESADYPGLALERGNLYEASGRTDEALKAYEAALLAVPDDLDLMLRVACGKAGAGQSEPALKLLEPVMEKRSNSAEANFCKGLAILNGEQDYNLARQFLLRAVGRDPSRAKYHLYVGWVAMELGDLSQAALSLDKTIELDRTLADAYWKRGELRVRNGAVVDALMDLDRALELSPSRLEAHAAAARAYEQIGKEPEAMAAWEKAVNAEAVQPVWHFQYGELLYVNQREEEARVQLEKAVTLGDKKDPPPTWLADAHRFYAMALGRGKPALPHWQRYLELKRDSNDPYKREAMREVDAILKMQGF